MFPKVEKATRKGCLFRPQQLRLAARPFNQGKNPLKNMRANSRRPRQTARINPCAPILRVLPRNGQTGKLADLSRANSDVGNERTETMRTSNPDYGDRSIFAALFVFAFDLDLGSTGSRPITASLETVSGVGSGLQ